MRKLNIVLGLAATIACGQVNAQMLRANFPGQLNQGNRLVPEETLTSPNGAYSLKFLADGSLRLYRNSDNRQTWVASSGQVSQGDSFSFLPTGATGTRPSRCAGLQKWRIWRISVQNMRSVLGCRDGSGRLLCSSR